MVRKSNLISMLSAAIMLPALCSAHAETASLRPHAENLQASERVIALAIMAQGEKELAQEAKKTLKAAEDLTKLPDSEEVRNCTLAGARLTLIAIYSAQGRSPSILLEVAQKRRDYAYFMGVCEQAVGLALPAAPNLR